MANENSDQGSGGRLRWWQEETEPKSAAGSRWYSAPPLPQNHAAAHPVASLGGHQAQALAVRPEELDIGDELEAEALRRAALERDAVVFEGIAEQTARKKWLQMLWILTPILLLQSLLALVTGQLFFLIPILVYVAEVYVIVEWLKRRLRRSPPQVTLSRLGMSLQMPGYRLGPVYWNEIKSVRARKLLFFRFLQVEFWDQKATFRRAFRGTSKWKALNWLNETLLSISAMQMDEAFLPVSAETVAARAAFYSTGSPNRK